MSNHSWLARKQTGPCAPFRCNGITRLEKLLFLVEKETDLAAEVDETFPFEPYHYGPYSQQVYDAVDMLESLQLLGERRIQAQSGLDLGEEVEGAR